MPRPLKIVQLGLEQVVMDGRRASKSNAAIALDCQQELLDRGNDDEAVSESAVKRYLATLDAHTVPALHAPQAIEQNAAMAVDITANINRLDELLKGWIEEAAASGVEKWGVMWDVATGKPIPSDKASDAIEAVPIFTADWHARNAMAKAMIAHVQMVTDLLERLYNAEQIALFQRCTLDAIRAASPETARAIVEAMQREQPIVRARLLGAAA